MKDTTYRATKWTPLWRSKNIVTGESRHFMGNGTGPRLFRTRKECKEWIEADMGYLRTRPDLKKEPHGWRMPVPVKVVVWIIEAWKQDGNS